MVVVAQAIVIQHATEVVVLAAPVLALDVIPHTLHADSEILGGFFGTVDFRSHLCSSFAP